MEATCCGTAAVWNLLVVGLIAGSCWDTAGWMIAGCCWNTACWMIAGCCWNTACWLIAGYWWKTAGRYMDTGYCKGAGCWFFQNQGLEYFSFCREVKFLSLCKIETWRFFGQNLFQQSDVKRKEKFWLRATFRKTGKWEWMIFAALQIGFRMKLCRHTTWPSCSQ